MAPEIINDKSYDCSTDIWSLGVLLYEMTHGYSPFSVREKVDNTAKAIFDNINNLNYAIHKNLSEECKDLLHRMLDIDSRSRIKINEIFEHPWIKKNENEMRGICVNNSNDGCAEQWYSHNKEQIITTVELLVEELELIKKFEKELSYLKRDVKNEINKLINSMRKTSVIKYNTIVKEIVFTFPEYFEFIKY